MQEVGLDLPTESQKEPDGPRPSSAVTRAQVVPEGWLEGAAWRPVGQGLVAPGHLALHTSSEWEL